MQLTKEKLREGVIKIKKIVFNKRNIMSFKEQLSLLHWRHTNFNGIVNEIYDMFLRTLLTSMMLISPYGSIFLKTRHQIPVDQQSSEEILEEKTKIIHQIS